MNRNWRTSALAGVIRRIGDRNWNSRKLYYGTNKELFDAELYGVDQVLEIVQKAGRTLARTSSQSTLRNFSMLQTIYIYIYIYVAGFLSYHIKNTTRGTGPRTVISTENSS